MLCDDAFEKRVEEQLALLRAEEDGKRELYDQTADGEPALRPSRSFIEGHLGPLRSEQELQKLAHEQAEREQRKDEAEARHREEVERSIREHNQRIEERAKRSRGRDRGR